ncbi:endonuclease G, partial [Reticulomyxa filosa]
ANTTVGITYFCFLEHNNDDKHNKNCIAVPTHFFKVLLTKNEKIEQFETASFIMSNHHITENLPLSAYQCEVTDIEKCTGLQFFTKAANNDQLYKMDLQQLFEQLHLSNEDKN